MKLDPAMEKFGPFPGTPFRELKMNREEIKLLYKLVYPLKGEFNGDYISACIYI